MFKKLVPTIAELGIGFCQEHLVKIWKARRLPTMHIAQIICAVSFLSVLFFRARKNTRQGSSNFPRQCTTIQAVQLLRSHSEDHTVTEPCYKLYCHWVWQMPCVSFSFLPVQLGYQRRILKQPRRRYCCFMPLSVYSRTPAHEARTCFMHLLAPEFCSQGTMKNVAQLVMGLTQNDFRSYKQTGKKGQPNTNINCLIYTSRSDSLPVLQKLIFCLQSHLCCVPDWASALISFGWPHQLLLELHGGQG